MNNVHMVLLKKGLTSKEKTEMLDQIKDVDGVKWALGMDSFVGAAFPDTMIPSNLKRCWKAMSTRWNLSAPNIKQPQTR